MTTITRARSSGAAVALLVVVAVLGISACGGSSSTNRSTTNSANAVVAGGPSAADRTCLKKTGHPSALAALISCRGADVRHCLAQHDALPFRMGGAFPTLASRINNPKYAAVLKDCGADLPQPLGFGQPLPRPAVKTIDVYVACVARNGYKLPTPNISGKGPVFPAGTDRISEYRVAAKNCVSIIQSGTIGTSGTGRATG